jgi:hypothetical protein
MRILSYLFAMALLSWGAIACQRSGGWNDAFERSEGWTYSDGAMTTALPGDRTVWLFGDTWVKGNTKLLFNSIAVQEGRSDRAPQQHELRFYGRDEGEALVDLGKSARSAARPWVVPRGDTPDAPGRSWLWPGGPRFARDKLISIYSEIACKHGKFPECRSYIGNMVFAGHSVVEVANAEQAPENWRVSVTPLVDRGGKSPAQRRLHWGSTLLEEQGWLYIFGASLTEAHAPKDVILARVVPERIAEYRAWQFLAPEGWRMFPAGPRPEELRAVAGGAAIEYSVDRVSRGGRARLVMVQADVFAREIVIRISSADDLSSVEWDAAKPGSGTYRLPLGDLDPRSAGGLTWAGRAHVELSSMPDKLLVSYFSEQIHRLRFVEVPVSGLRPWCATGACVH